MSRASRASYPQTGGTSSPRQHVSHPSLHLPAPCQGTSTPAPRVMLARHAITSVREDNCLKQFETWNLLLQVNYGWKHFGSLSESGTHEANLLSKHVNFCQTKFIATFTYLFLLPDTLKRMLRLDKSQELG